MLRTTALAALAAALFVSAPAAAAEEDTQFWTTGSAVVPLGDTVNATLMASQRFRENSDVQVYRASVDKNLSPRLSLGGGLTYVAAGPKHEWRTHQQALLTFDHLSFRTQLEEIFRPGAARPALRLRERAQYTVPLDTRDSLSGSVELLYTARTDGTGRTGLGQWRTALLLRHRVSPHLDASGGYMLIVSPQPGANRISHAPQLSLTYRP